MSDESPRVRFEAADGSSDGRAREEVTFDPVTGELVVTGRSADGGEEGLSRSAGRLETRLPPKPARLLALLLGRSGELVPREEVVAELWPDQHLDVDQGLAYTVRQVRMALGDDAGDPRFIETLPRRGYRFIGRLREGAEDDFTIPAAEPPASREARRPAVGLFRGAFRGFLLAGLLAAVTALTAALAPSVVGEGARSFFGRLFSEGREQGAAPIRIALLPLRPPERLEGDADARSINRRLTERLLVALTARRELDVVGPATTARPAAAGGPQTELGRRLGVAFVVSGGHGPDEGVLFLQLIRVSDGGHLFARRYSGTADELAARLPEIAAALAAEAERGSARRGADPAVGER